jgi:hypothetical protein
MSVIPKKSNYKTILVCGLKQIGKTNETVKQLLFSYIRKLQKKVLVYDPNRDQLAHYRIDGLLPDGSPNPNAIEVTIPQLPHNRVWDFSCQREVQMRRITPFTPNGMELDEEQQIKLLVNCFSNFYGGALFIDDLNFTLGDTLPLSFTKYLTNNSHRNCDIILHVQDIGRALPKMWQNINIVRLHHQNGGCVPAEGKLSHNYPILRVAELIVERQYNSGNERYFIYVDIDKQKIRGNYTAQMLIQAIGEYIDYDAQKLVSRYEKARDQESGKKVYNYSTARQRVKTELFKKFFPA